MSNKDKYKKLDCAVCGQAASGFHYGATTCEACKVFFRRTVGKNLPSSPLCTGNCVASAHPETGKMSFTCPLCRLNKCLQAGMKRLEGKRGRYSYEMKARHSASSGSTLPTTTASVTPQKIPTRGQNCSPSHTKTSVESLGTIDNSQSCQGNVLGLIDTQVSMPTEDLQLLDLNEIERDLSKLNENTQDPLQLHMNELDLNENGQDLLREAWALCLELENSETACGDSLNPPESNNGFTQSSSHGSKTELSEAGAEGTVLFIPPAVEHPSGSSLVDSSHSARFTTEAHTGGPKKFTRIPPSFGTRSTSASGDSDSESEPQCFPAAPGTKAGNTGGSNDYLSAIFERNRNRQRTETEEELDTLISKASARMDERFNLFMMQKPKQGGESDTATENQGRRSSRNEQPKGAGNDGK